MQELAVKWAVALALVGAMLGCASPERVADSIVDSNAAQEAAANRLMLLNIVRASHRQPLHFLRISQVRLPIGVGNTSFNLPIPFGPGRSRAYELGNSFGQSYGVDSAIQDSQEFMQGVSNPVPPTLMAYYLDQGWPQSLILHLFVKHIEIYRVEGKNDPVLVSRLTNYPPDKDEMTAFQKMVQALEPCRFEFTEKPEVKVFGPKLTEDRLRDLRGVAELRKAEITFSPVDSNGSPTTTSSEYRLAKVSKEVHFDLNAKLGKTCDKIDVPILDVPKTRALNRNVFSTLLARVAGGGFGGEKTAQDRAGDKAAEATTDTKHHANFILRSPEGMIYFLGEVLRTQKAGRGIFLGDEGWNATTPSSSNRRLFGLDVGAHRAAPFYVSYLGTTYALPPGSEEDRTTQVMWLVMQVLSLQNKGTASPVTSTVRIVN